MIAVHFTYKGQPRILYAKLESYNFTGSIKDRMALYVLQKAYEQNRIKSGDLICEATSGNTGIAFSAIGRALGHRTRIYMPNWLSRERVDVIRGLGAEIVLVSKEEGGFLGSIEQTEVLARDQEAVFLPCQFTNEHNIEAHEKTTGPEILRQLGAIGKKPDAFIAGVGTGGTVMGVARALKAFDPSIKIHPLEPAESPTLSTGYKVGSHRIQGISDEFIPAIVQLDQLDPIVDAHDGDAILIAQKLSSQLGLAVGISSGANFIGALKVQNELGDDSVIATIFCDCNKKYLSTDLMRDEPVKQGYFAPDIEFTGFQTVAALG